MKCDEIESKSFDGDRTAYELMEANGLLNTAKRVKEAIAELKAELHDTKARADLAEAGKFKAEHHAQLYLDERNYAEKQLRQTIRALWLMTAEWAEAMGLASCNIANKFMSKERFEFQDESNRDKTIKKYRHRQVVFYKYGEYCRAKADEFKEDV